MRIARDAKPRRALEQGAYSLRQCCQILSGDPIPREIVLLEAQISLVKVIPYSSVTQDLHQIPRQKLRIAKRRPLNTRLVKRRAHPSVSITDDRRSARNTCERTAPLQCNWTAYAQVDIGRFQFVRYFVCLKHALCNHLCAAPLQKRFDKFASFRRTSAAKNEPQIRRCFRSVPDARCDCLHFGRHVGRTGNAKHYNGLACVRRLPRVHPLWDICADGDKLCLGPLCRKPSHTFERNGEDRLRRRAIQAANHSILACTANAINPSP